MPCHRMSESKGCAKDIYMEGGIWCGMSESEQSKEGNCGKED